MARPSKNYDIATRSQALTLKAAGFKNSQITELTSIPPCTIQRIWERVINCGYDPKKPILDIYVQEKERSGRPIKQTPEV